MAMAMRVQSPPLEYPDSDGFVDENGNDDDDHQDELVTTTSISFQFLLLMGRELIENRKRWQPWK